MGKQSNETAYSREHDVVSRFKEISKREDLTIEEYQEVFQEMFKHYENLLSDTKLLTSVGDRLQRKLKSANIMMAEQKEEIERINESLVSTNQQLQDTIDELTKAKASRKAQAYILLIALALFIASELVEDQFATISNNFFLNMLLKVCFLFPVRYIEGYLEGYFIRKAIEEERKQKEAEQAEATEQKKAVARRVYSSLN
jgi:hypothetical protein